MFRMGSVVVGMEVAALLVAYLAFGWPVLLIGAPLLVGTVLMFAMLRVSETPRRRLQERRAAQWDPAAALPGGLMSGFFEIPAQNAPADPVGNPPART